MKKTGPTAVTNASSASSGAGPISIREGSATAGELYLAAGIALSFFASGEDMLTQLFKHLCEDREPTAFDTYKKAPRRIRADMLRFAITLNRERFHDEEIKSITKALKAIDKLAETRNEIAHGHCSDVRHSVNGVEVMKGHFIVPSLSERDWKSSDKGFAYSAKDIDSFTEKVREQRGVVMDAYFALVQGEQEAGRVITREGQLTIQRAKQIAYSLIPAADVLNHLKLVKPPS